MTGRRKTEKRIRGRDRCIQWKMQAGAPQPTWNHIFVTMSTLGTYSLTIKVMQLTPARRACAWIGGEFHGVFHPLSLYSILLNLSQANAGTSVVFQWLRIRLPMQGTWVQSLVRELRSHMPQGNRGRILQLLNLYTTTRETVSCKKRSWVPQLWPDTAKINRQIIKNFKNNVTFKIKSQGNKGLHYALHFPNCLT